MSDKEIRDHYQEDLKGVVRDLQEHPAYAYSRLNPHLHTKQENLYERLHSVASLQLELSEAITSTTMDVNREKQTTSLKDRQEKDKVLLNRLHHVAGLIDEALQRGRDSVTLSPQRSRSPDIQTRQRLTEQQYNKFFHADYLRSHRLLYRPLIVSSSSLLFGSADEPSVHRLGSHTFPPPSNEVPVVVCQPYVPHNPDFDPADGIPYFDQRTWRDKDYYASLSTRMEHALGIDSSFSTPLITTERPNKSHMETNTYKPKDSGNPNTVKQAWQEKNQNTSPSNIQRTHQKHGSKTHSKSQPITSKQREKTHSSSTNQPVDSMEPQSSISPESHRDTLNRSSQRPDTDGSSRQTIKQEVKLKDSVVQTAPVDWEAMFASESGQSLKAYLDVKNKQRPSSAQPKSILRAPAPRSPNSKTYWGASTVPTSKSIRFSLTSPQRLKNPSSPNAKSPQRPQKLAIPTHVQGLTSAPIKSAYSAPMKSGSYYSYSSTAALASADSEADPYASDAFEEDENKVALSSTATHQVAKVVVKQQTTQQKPQIANAGNVKEKQTTENTTLSQPPVEEGTSAQVKKGPNRPTPLIVNTQIAAKKAQKMVYSPTITIAEPKPRARPQASMGATNQATSLQSPNPKARGSSNSRPTTPSSRPTTPSYSSSTPKRGAPQPPRPTRPKTPNTPPPRTPTTPTKRQTPRESANKSEALGNRPKTAASGGRNSTLQNTVPLHTTLSLQQPMAEPEPGSDSQPRTKSAAVMREKAEKSSSSSSSRADSPRSEDHDKSAKEAKGSKMIQEEPPHQQPPSTSTSMQPNHQSGHFVADEEIVDESASFEEGALRRQRGHESKHTPSRPLIR
eukprot:TRINITY_DN1320_c0_g1_i1.p1 TRINITY_DN1320_c0_g1~~TRINITY_DN1320_c0_g1_i1.p1  ORF type:complete len:847 (-),score=182.17 TRINITY_DN1320_c0_g1_i1:35-2575(-)